MIYTYKFIQAAPTTHSYWWKSERGYECFVNDNSSRSALPRSSPLKLTDLNLAYRSFSAFPIDQSDQQKWYYLVEELNPEEIVVVAPQ